MAVLTHCCPPRWISIDVFRLVFTSFFKCCLLRCDNTTHILSRPPKSYDIPFMRDFCCEILLFFFSGFCFVMMEDISRYTQECFCVYCERVGSPLLLCVKHSSTKLSSQKKIVLSKFQMQPAAEIILHAISRFQFHFFSRSSSSNRTEELIGSKNWIYTLLSIFCAHFMPMHHI